MVFIEREKNCRTRRKILGDSDVNKVNPPVGGGNPLLFAILRARLNVTAFPFLKHFFLTRSQNIINKEYSSVRV